jgi:hypothetical protein
MPADVRRSAGIDDETAATIRSVMLRSGMEEAARLVPDGVVRRFAVVGDRDGAVGALARIREDAAPDMFLLPVNDYSRAAEFVTPAAGILLEAGFQRSG